MLNNAVKNRTVKGAIEMSEKLEVVKGSGNVFRDLGEKGADIKQTKALLAAEIIRILDKEKLSVRASGIVPVEKPICRGWIDGWWGRSDLPPDCITSSTL